MTLRSIVGTLDVPSSLPTPCAMQAIAGLLEGGQQEKWKNIRRSARSKHGATKLVG